MHRMGQKNDPRAGVSKGTGRRITKAEKENGGPVSGTAVLMPCCGRAQAPRVPA